VGEGEFTVIEAKKKHSCGVDNAKRKAEKARLDMETRISSLEKKREEAAEEGEDADKVVGEGRSSGQKKVKQQPHNDDDSELSSLCNSDDDKKTPTSTKVGFSSTSRRSSSRQPVKAYSSAFPSAKTSLVSKRSRPSQPNEMKDAFAQLAAAAVDPNFPSKHSLRKEIDTIKAVRCRFRLLPLPPS
jgi:hypothetical protein